MKVLILTISLLLASQASAQIEARLFSGKQNRYAETTFVDSMAFRVSVQEQPNNFFIAFDGFGLYVQFGEKGHGFHVWQDGSPIIRRPEIETLASRYDVHYTALDSLRIYRNDSNIVTLPLPVKNTVRVGTWDIASVFELPALEWSYSGSWLVPETPAAIDTIRSENIKVSWLPNSESDISHYIAVVGDTVRVDHPGTMAAFNGLNAGEWQAFIYAVNDEGMTSAPAIKDFYVQSQQRSNLYDLNGDGRVDSDDYNVILRHLGARQGDSMWRPDIDFFKDGQIDVRDIREWYIYWKTL